jgi:hypothetical protein
MRPSTLRTLLFLVALAGFTTSASAYVIVLKNGTTMEARDKYRVDGDRIVFSLPNGTQATLALAEVDVAKTEALNSKGYGGATVLDTTTVPPAEKAGPARQSLTDYIAGQDRQLRELPTVRRESKDPSVAAGKTKAGYDDLFGLERANLPDLELGSEIKRVFRNEGVDAINVYAGSQRKRALVEVTTNSEAALFRALEVAAKATSELAKLRPGEVEALEVVMLTEARGRGGQFVLTPELAAELVAKPQEVAAFFVRNVQF